MSRGAVRLAALALVCSACGWHSGLTGPGGAHSVAVLAATREGTVLERGLEPLLTDALSKAVVDWVDLPLVAPEHADFVIRPKVLEFRRRGGVRNRDNELLETAVLVRAQAELVDREGKVRGVVQAQEWSGYALDDPSNEDAARDRALRHVADSLVLELFAPGSAVDAGAAPPARPDLGGERPFD